MFSDMDSINFLSICFMLFVMRLKSKVTIGTAPYLELLERVLLDEWEMAVKELPLLQDGTGNSPVIFKFIRLKWI